MTNSQSVFVRINLFTSSSACPFVLFDSITSEQKSSKQNYSSHNDSVVTYKNIMKSKAKVNTEPIGVCHG